MLLRDGRERRLLPSPHGRMAFQHHRWKITWVLGLGLLAGPAVCGAQSGKLPVPTTGVYLGIWADPDLPMMVQPPVTKNQESAVEIREGPAPWGINHPFALHLVYYNWTDIQTEVVNGTFPDSSLQGDIEHGRIPVISWHCDQSTTSGNTDALIASGDATETATITATAQALAKYPGPVLLRWFWEFNLLQSSEAGLNQYCLGDVGSTGTTLPPQVYADFIAAWQRIWQLFQQAGATNVSFLWNPGSYNSDTDPSYPGPYYPGSAFVDWIGVENPPPHYGTGIDAVVQRKSLREEIRRETHSG